MSTIAPLVTGTLVTVTILYVLKRVLQSKRPPLPPGPPKKFIVGNIFDSPKEGYDWEQYHRWSQQYDSEIIHLDMAGRSIIVLDTAQAVEDLLDKRSNIYSSRARAPMIHEMMGWTMNFGLMPYDAPWKLHRKQFVQEFSPSAVTRYYPNQIKGAHELLRRLLESPDDLMKHLRLWTGTLILSMAYGIDAQGHDDPYVRGADLALASISEASVPGAFLVDSLPILKYVPEWVLPGGGFKKKAREWKKIAHDMTFLPFEEAKRKITSGTYDPSFVSSAMQRIDPKGDIKAQEDTIKATALTMFLGAADTSVAAVSSFILTLALYPDVQAKAQAELEAAYGAGHLPTFGDFEADYDDYGENASLPYLTACLKELLRYEPIAPFGVPHSSTEDDIYKGYFISKGSIIMPNSWSILNDEATYGPDTHKFIPERFLLPNGKLNSAVKDPKTAAFGYGRRICPGQAFALSSVWMAMSSILTVFNVSDYINKNGGTEVPSRLYSSGLIVYPLPFQCRLTPRSEDIARAVRNTEFE